MSIKSLSIAKWCNIMVIEPIRTQRCKRFTHICDFKQMCANCKMYLAARVQTT